MLDQAARPKIVGTIRLPIGKKSAAPEPAPPAPEPPPPPKAVKTKPAVVPPRDKYALPGKIDLTVELPPEHRATASDVAIEARVAISLKLIEATRGVAEAPRETRAPRLTLAACETFPAHTPNWICWALQTFIEQKSEQKLSDAAGELRKAIRRVTNSAKVARFAPMLRGSIDVLDRRASPRSKRRTRDHEKPLVRGWGRGVEI